MNKEIKALEQNNTWSLTPLPSQAHAIDCKWIFKVKYNSDGTVERYKARVVAKGYTQVEGIDYHDTFAPVTKMTTVRCLLAIAAAKQWPIFQLDVDNAFLHGTSPTLIKQIKEFIHDKFRIKDLGHFKYFLGIEVARSKEGIFINQRKYVLDILEDQNFTDSKPVQTPVETKHGHCKSTSPAITDPTMYRKLVGKLIYLTITRPDLAFAVHTLSQFMATPAENHLKAAHRLLRYIKLAPAQGILFSATSDLKLTGYCDANWIAPLLDAPSQVIACSLAILLYLGKPENKLSSLGHRRNPNTVLWPPPVVK
ncbi:unnamed protein product [Rhodiola kirilowii]